MDNNKIGLALVGVVGVAVLAGLGLGQWIKHEVPEGNAGVASSAVAATAGKDYLRAVYDPIHFQPAIANAQDDQCLACHKEILDDKVRPASPAGVKASTSKAWYQQLSTYTGDQDTFHRRHLTTPLAKELMALRCTTCHQGHDPREEAPGSSATGVAQSSADFTLRKQVNPEATCLKCHGQMPTQLMGLPAPWPESKSLFGDTCMTCHVAIRTTRHQVNYLKADAIEFAGKKNADVCYGCHGGRAWYRISYPYPRHPWPGMAPEIPDWAQDRPTQSEARFLATGAGAAPAKH